MFDIFTIDGDKVLWPSEWKSTWGEEGDIYSRLSQAKDSFVENGKQGPRVEDAIKYGLKLPDYGYAFAIKITESHIEIMWEKVKIPKP